MRKLKAKDLFIVGSMLRKVAPELVKVDFKGDVTQDTDERASNLGKVIVPLVFDACFEDAWAWLADVAEMSIDEFNSQAVDFPIEVVEYLIKTEDMKSFFVRAGSLIK